MTTQKFILVVDDDPISLKALLEALEDLGYKIVSATQGQQAWDLLIADPDKYAAVIVDRIMENVDGMELLRRIKSSSHLRHLPVIIETGEAEPEEFIEALKMGAFDFIYKPVELKLLMYVMKRAIEKELLDRQTSFDIF